MLLILLIITVLLMVLQLIENNNIYESYANKYKIIKPTCKKDTIFRSINKLDNELSELTYLIKKNKRQTDKYDIMHKWYEDKLKSNTLNNTVIKEKSKQAGNKMKRQLSLQQSDDNRRLMKMASKMKL
jgi:hypothetical protein